MSKQIVVPAGVKSSIRNIFKYNYVQSHVTNLSRDYVIDWKTWEMIRESIQNMMDEAQYMSEDGAWDLGPVTEWERRVGQHYVDFQLADFCKIWVKDKYLYLADMGRGVDFEQIYLVGESGKRNKGFRGEKGEGEVLSFLIAARLGIEKWMFSQDWAVTARFTKVNGYQVLTMDEYRTNGKSLDDRHWGTIWRYHYAPLVAIQYKRIYDMFPDLSRERIRADKALDNKMDEMQRKRDSRERRKEQRERKKKNTASKKLIFTPRKGTPSRLFIKGIYVKDLDAIFSYNLREAGINRDRNMVNDMDILDEIQAAFNSDDFNYSMAKAFWAVGYDERWTSTPLEFRKVLTISNEITREHLRKAFFVHYGKDACIQTDIGATTDALAMKLNVVEVHPMIKAMALVIGIPSDTEIVGSHAKGTYLDKRTLSKKERKRLAALNLLGAKIIAGMRDSRHVPALNVTSKFLTSMNKEKKNNVAIYNRTGQEIIILRRLLKGDPMELIEAYIHELGHHVTGASDRTRVFESWFTKMMVESIANPNQLLTKIVRIIINS